MILQFTRIGDDVCIAVTVLTNKKNKSAAEQGNKSLFNDK